MCPDTCNTSLSSCHIQTKGVGILLACSVGKTKAAGGGFFLRNIEFFCSLFEDHHWRRPQSERKGKKYVESLHSLSGKIGVSSSEKREEEKRSGL